MFVFKFEKLLNLKENMIKKCLLEIAEIDLMIRKHKKTKYILEEENENRKNTYNGIIKENPQKNILTFIAENIEKTQNNIYKLDTDIEMLKKEKADKIQEVKNLNMEKKKLEKLKEKDLERYNYSQNKAETRFLDEVANIKSANRIINS